MQLLDSEQLEFAFQLHGISLETQARRFYADIWQTIQGAEKTSNASELIAHEKHLRSLCQSYFAQVNDWRIEEEDRFESQPACEISSENMKEATVALPAFEKQFFRYLLCYMELNRALIRARARISHFAKDHNIDAYKDSLAVNHGTGLMLDQAHRDAAILQRKRLHIEQIRRVLQPTDPLMEELGAMLPQIMNVEGDHQLTLLKGALRRREFARAQDIVSKWPTECLRVAGQSIVASMHRNVKTISLGESMVLHSGELSLISATLNSDEAKAHAFLVKYNVPYMVFQYKALLHLGYLLGRVGSIEGLIIQHAKLASMSVRPHIDPDYAKNQQQALLLPVRSLFKTGFGSLGQIFGDMERTLAVLDKYISQTQKYMAMRGL